MEPDVFGQGFFSTVLSWGIGLVFGIVLAAISFFWYYAAIVILGGALGYFLGIGFLEWLGLDAGFLGIVVGLIVGAIFAVATFVLGVPVLLVIVFSAFSGAAAVVNGVLIFLGQIKLEDLDTGIFGAADQRRRSSSSCSSSGCGRPVLADARRRRSITTIERSSYRY